MQKIIFIDNGKAIVGTHDEFMKTNLTYRQLYESQVGGEEHEEK